MSDMSRKISLGQNLAAIGLYAAQTQQDQNGWQLPCVVSEVNGSFVKVSFQVRGEGIPLPQIEVPIYGWEYIRFPIQVGDPGVTISIDANLFNICGQSEGLPNFVSNGNFGATLMFLPIMSKKMSDTDDTQAVVIYGPNGVIIRDTEGNTVIKVSATGMVSVQGNVLVDGSLTTTENIVSGTGATGTFTTADGSVVTVQAGIITSIV